MCRNAIEMAVREMKARDARLENIGLTVAPR